MAVVLVVRPYGLLGKPEAAGHGGAVATAAEPVLRPASALARGAGGAVILGLLALPLVAGRYVQYLIVEIYCLALFAASLHFIMGPGGMVSFGHAAYFGLGAYGAALMVKYLAVTMAAALATGVAVALLGGLVFGWFCVRLSGVYLAMLSLAFAQIVHAVAFQWYEFTGGDNGIFGIWPAEWASGPTAYYYFALALNLLAVLLLRRIVYAPFGYTLRAGRDSPLRADAIGIDVRRHQWLAFALAGTFAGLSGGVLAFLKGSIDTTWLAIPQSIEALVMVLLGGVQTLIGPLVGAAGYHALEIWMSRLTDLWPLFLGALIIVLCVAFPQGVVGFAQARLRAAEP